MALVCCSAPALVTYPICIGWDLDGFWISGLSLVRGVFIEHTNNAAICRHQDIRDIQQSPGDWVSHIRFIYIVTN
ncbi:uncharacterized protein P174DRAFT_165103 [Aspergillus novofumigatus IBT 16806]|uniref:Uncharacterized protein n=1 Tax=Aspergillus novofumigatus (strain IBT 16806) TaxID=1392255 RepID=A0A2I1C8G4_ASPN1|nr:uncharacterized protein P174DRAFT_165103 [Aspergillus novofumigatus IBT 16806]PKX93920.1 hypothetical protein P174DRAFT_165103 [Aspergillus novofumigatus IBT 16806]